MEILGRILLGMGAGLLFGVVPLVLGFLLGKNTGGIIGIFVCTVCGGLFGFLEKSSVLTLIVMVIIVLFIVTDKSRPIYAKSTQRTNAGSGVGSDESNDTADVTEDTASGGQETADSTGDEHSDTAQ